MAAQVSHKAITAGAFTALWPKSKYTKNNVRVLVLRRFFKVPPLPHAVQHLFFF